MDPVKGGAGKANGKPVRAILTQPDAVGALSRQLDVLVLDISRSGCQFESAFAIAAGTVAVVRLGLDGVEYSDVVKVTRSVPLEGAGDRYRIGAEFVWVSAPERHSLRCLASRIGPAGVQPVRPRGQG